MPRRSKKKNFRSRRGARRQQPMLALGRSPIPDKSMVKLRYCQRCAINPAAGVTNSYLFRANSLFDPDLTGTGHQPLGFDEWAKFYRTYCVLGSKITVQAVNVSTTIPIMYGVLLRQVDNPGTIVDPTLLLEQGDSSWRYAGNMNNSTRSKVVKTFSTKKFLGFTNPQDEADCKALVTENPAAGGNYQVWAAAADGVADPPNIQFNIIIEYVAMFSQPQAIGQS